MPKTNLYGTGPPLLYDSADEAHRRFAPGCSARLEDVATDGFGIALGLFGARRVFR
jgi:VanZ family protein